PPPPARPAPPPPAPPGRPAPPVPAETPDLPPLRLIHRGGHKRPPDAPRTIPGARGRSRWLLGGAAVLVALAVGGGGLTVGRDRGDRGQTVALGAPAAGGASA